MGVRELYEKKQKEEKAKASSSLYRGVKNLWMSQNANGVREDINNRVQNWANNYQSFINSHNQRFETTNNNAYRADAGRWASNAISAKMQFDKEANEIRNLLDEYKDFFVHDDWAGQVLTVLAQGEKGQSEIVNFATKDLEYWSNWDSEDAYKKALAEYEAYTAKANLDLDAEKKTIDELKIQIDTAKKGQNQVQALKTQIAQNENKLRTMGRYDLNAQKLEKQIEQDKATLAQLESQYGYLNVDALEKRLARKEQDYVLASRVQEGERLASVVNNADFEQFSEKGMNVENPTFDSIHNDYYNVFGFNNADEINDRITNKATFVRDNQAEAVKASAQGIIGGAGDTMPYYDNLLNQMTDEEVKIYSYYVGKGDYDTADRYLETLADTLAARQAGESFEAIENKPMLEILFGAAAGLDQYMSGVKNLGNLIKGEEDYIASSPSQHLLGMIKEDFANSDSKFWGAIGTVAFDIVNTAANMLPSILVSTVPVLGGVLGSATLGASAAGNAYAEMVNLGYGKGQARTYAALIGGSEAGLQYLLGGISSLGGVANKGIMNTILSKVDNALARTAIQIGGNMASEFTEEALQSILEPWFKSLVTKTDFEAPNIDEVLYSGLLGALTAGLLEGPGTIAGTMQTASTGRQIKGREGAVERLKNLGSTLSPESVAYKLAGKVNSNTGAYTIGRLFYEAGAQVNEQNKADIVKALTRRNVLPNDANVIANAFEDIVNGAELTKAQQSILNSNPVIGETIMQVLINPNHTVNQRRMGMAEVAASLKNTPQISMRDTKPTADTTQQATEGVEGVSQPKPSTVSFNAPEVELSRFKASEDGVTRVSDSTEGTDIAYVEDIKDGNILLRTTDGQTVNADDVSFKNKETAYLYETLADMGISTPAEANRIIRGYDPNADITLEEYARGINEAYQYGAHGYAVTDISSKGMAALLSEEQRAEAHLSGKNTVWAKTMEQQAEIDKKKAEAVALGVKPKKGGVYFGDKVATESDMKGKLQKTSLKGLTFLSEALGADIHLFESYKNEKGKIVFKNAAGNEVTAPNGWINADGSIWIDTNAGNDGKGTMLYTASHELTHFIQRFSPAKYRVLSDFIVEKYSSNGKDFTTEVALKMERAKDNGREIDEREAFNEVIADACSTMLLDSEAFRELASRDKTLADKIKEFLEKFVAKIRAAYEKLSPDAREARFLRSLKEGLDEISAIWTEALVDAGETYSILANMQNSADGAPVHSDFTAAIAEMSAEAGETFSLRTEYEPLPKQIMSLSTTGTGEIIGIIEGLKAEPVKGISDKTINGYTGRAVRENAMKLNGFTVEQIKNTNKFLDKMAEVMKEAGVTYRFIGLQDVEKAKLHYTYNADGSIKSIVLSAMIKNGDYPVNFDLSSICKKRDAMSKLVDKLAKRGSLDSGVVDLSASNIFQINKALKDAGYETACLGCFVESKRYNSLDWAKKFCNKWNSTVKKINPKATYFGYGSDTFTDEDLTLEQAAKIDQAANKYYRTAKAERMENALKKYVAREKAGEPLVEGKTLKVDGKELYTFSKAARKRLEKSEFISDELKDKYLTCDVSTLNMSDVEFLLETGILPGATLSNNQAVRELVSSGEPYQHLLRPSDLLTDRGLSKLRSLPNFHGVLYGHYGSATPKLIQSYTPYNSEIALLPARKNRDVSLVEYLYSIAGVRMQSFSDFQIQNVYDYLQMMADLAARRLPAHAYTKEISFARLLGMTGMKVNLSVMFDIDISADREHAGLTRYNPLVHKGEYARIVLRDAQGDWVYNIGDYQTQKMYAEAFPEESKRFLQSIGFADAVVLEFSEGYSSNCGIIGVGYSDLGIIAMLDDNRIRYIIPYHASSLPSDIKIATNIEHGRDYTDSQNNTKIVSIVDKNGRPVSWSIKEAYKRLKSGSAVMTELNKNIREKGWVVTTKKSQNGHGSFDLYGNLEQTQDPRKTAENFMDWCAKNGTLPLFYQFSEHNNYYKLLYDFNVYDCLTEQYAPQRAVTNTYPTKNKDGDVVAKDVSSGGFDSTYLTDTIHKQMSFMNEYNRNLDSDLDRLADNAEKGRFTLEPSLEEKFAFSERDQTYLDAVKRGDTETAQRLVDEAASEAGYTVKGYHGTDNNFGFTNFENKSGAIFFTSRIDVAETYSGKEGVTPVQSESDAGNYSLFANLGNTYVFKGKGKSNGRLPVPEDYKNPYKRYLTTDEYAEYAKEKGYDSITFESIGDIGLHWKWDTSGTWPVAITPEGEYNVYAVFSPDQIKSADPVTYDDNGNVIPLSQRFNSSETDIRFSERDNSFWNVSIDEIIEELLESSSDISLLEASERLNLSPEVAEAIISREGLGDSHLQAGKTAVMSQNRLNRDIENSGAGSKRDYARRYITRISPTDFIDLTVSSRSIDRQIFDEYVEGDSGNTMGEVDYTQALKNSISSPYLSIDLATGRVIGHNGRHRMRALEIAGIESVEIEVEFYDRSGSLVKYNAKKIKNKNISSQFDTNIQTTISNIIPMNESYRADIESLYGEKANKDAIIKYSERDQAQIEQETEARNLLGEEISELDLDVKELNKMVKATKAKISESTEVINKVGRMLMEENGVRGRISDLAPLLKEFYSSIEKGDMVSWEAVNDAAAPVVDWIQAHYGVEDAYTKGILTDLRKRRIYLDETQKAEVASTYGSYNDFRRKAMGRVIIANTDSVSLDTAWQELAELYPEYFDAETNTNDMPAKLMEIVDTLQSAGEKYSYFLAEEMFSQSLAMQVYDSYWKAATLGAVNETAKKLSAEHRNKMQELRKKHKANEDKLRKRYQAMLKNARQRAVESRSRTELRHRIKKEVKALNNLLLRGTKDKHVMDGLQAVVAEALEAVNMDTVGASERIYGYVDENGKTHKGYNQMIEEALAEGKEDLASELTATRDRIAKQGDGIKSKLEAFKNAYANIRKSNDPSVASMYYEEIENKIESVVDKVGNTPLRFMSEAMLEEVLDLYKMVHKVIRDSNKAFRAEKSAKITENAETVASQIFKEGGEKEYMNKVQKVFNRLGFSMLKPEYFFKMLGSERLLDLYHNLRKGEDTFYKDIEEGKKFFDSISEKYKYREWVDAEPKTFTAAGGKTFKLGVEEMMAIYAYTRRDLDRTPGDKGLDATKHLTEGGIVLTEDVTPTRKFGIGKILGYTVNTKRAYRLKPETVGEIVASLTEDQKHYVEQMQEFLSSVMGAKGNEVTMELFGIKGFKEKYYFPIKSSSYYMGFKPQEAGEVRIKNPSFSKDRVPNANNPVVLTGFTDVWKKHVEDMSMYHSFTLPLEDFTRVYNYRTKSADDTDTTSVKATISSAYGVGATDYIEKFLRDLNGGVRTEKADILDSMISLSKKGSVMASASVVVQQYSALTRAFALVDPKYFVKSLPQGVNLKNHSKDWEELKTYAPIAGIKEMGRFDTGMGRSTGDWIASKQTVREKMDDILSKAPAFADEVVWVQIWQAVKRETVHNNPNLNPKSEEFLQKAGERFTEVVSLTQVYDSVFSRSGMMRSQNTLMKMATAFMAEPTVQLNMLAEGLIQGKKLGLKMGTLYASRVAGSVASSLVLNAALKSIVMAARDDDEDETYAEKYVEAFSGDLLESINPLTMIPIAKDILSIFKGYEVKRMDMNLFSDLVRAFENLDRENISQAEKWADLAGAISAFFGVPLKNVKRDIMSVINVISTVASDNKTTAKGLRDAILEGITGDEKSVTDKLYEAISSGDEAYLKEVQKQLEGKNYSTYVRKALRENDARIRKAAEAGVNGDVEERVRIAREIIAEGNFSQDDVVAAINSEMSAIRNATAKEEEVATTETEAPGTATSVYKATDIVTAFENGDTSLALEIIEELVDTHIANGKTEKEAKSSVRSSMTSKLKPMYIAADSETRSEIRFFMKDSGLYGRASDILDTCKNWLKDA